VRLPQDFRILNLQVRDQEVVDSKSAPATIYLIFQAEDEQKHCSKFVVVLGSEPAKSNTDGSSPLRCNSLRNIVESEIFRTRQKSGQVYESAALTAELRAPRYCNILS